MDGESEAMDKWVFTCRHGKHLIHVLYSRMKPASDWDNDGDKLKKAREKLEKLIEEKKMIMTE